MLKIPRFLLFMLVLWRLNTVESENLINWQFQERPLLADSGRRCLGACTCYDDDNFVDCEAKEYEYVPHDIPTDAKALNLNQNVISEIGTTDFRDLEQLTQLHVAHNSISAIAPLSFANLASLEELSLGNNFIRSISRLLFSGLGSLKRLDMQYSGIQNIAPNAFADLKNLQYLNLDYNMLFLLGNGTFTGLTNLTSLRIGGTYLFEIPMEALEPVKRTLIQFSMIGSTRLTTIGELGSAKIDLPNLQHLNLSYCRIGTIWGEGFSGLPRLKTLDLSGNVILLLAPRVFVGMPQLESLHLRQNVLQAFPYSALSPVSKTLLNLEISAYFTSLGNLSAIYDSSYLSNLTTIIFENTELSSISEESFFNNLVQLKHLTISYTSLQRLPTQALRYLQNLQTLRFVGNAVKEILPGDIPNLPNLKEFEFTQSALSSVNESCFESVSLDILRLNNNKITSITSNSLENQQNLLNIDISNNLLETPNDMWFRDKPLQEIRLTGNPWNCDCRSANYRAWTESAGYQNIMIKDQVTCNQPRTLRSKQLSNINENQLTCEFETCPSTCVCSGISNSQRRPSNMCSAVDTMARLLTPACRELPKGETTFSENRRIDKLVTSSADCTGSDMTEFPDVPPTTEYLSIASNKITALQRKNFENLKSLKILVASSNQISTIGNSTFADVGLIEYIFLNKNILKGTITSEWWKNLGNLMELRLDDNEIEEIAANAFVDLISLQTLDISRNAITYLNPDMFTGLSKLVNLNLPSNAISAIANDTFENLFSLAYLNLYNNHLSTLPGEMIINNLNLIYLDLGDNSFVDLGDRFLLSDSLEFLKMEDGFINALRNGSFVELPKLTTLRLAGNSISGVEQNAFRMDQGVSELKLLDLNYNGLLTIPVEAFVGLNKLETLGLNDNYFTSIPSWDDTEGQFLPSLKTLSLANTGVSEILENSFISKLQNLVTLVMNNCKFSHIPVNGLTALNKLERLILDANPISNIERDLSLLVNLAHLQLSDTEALEFVADTAFESLTKLETLQLHNGRLQQIPLTAFKNMINLEVLTLSDNKLTHPHKEWFFSINPEKVKSITLHGNPWECDCNMAEYKNWFDNGADGIDEHFVSITCSSPQNYKSWKLDEINESELLCVETTTSLPTQPTSAASTDCDRCAYDDALRKLDCSGLRLSSIPRNCIPPDTKTLVLSTNSIGEIRDHLRDLSSLKELFLDDNRISIISDDAFSDLSSLEHLDISHNRLTEVPTNALSTLSQSLVSLLLDDQRILQINENDFPLNVLKQLSLQSLSGNPTPLSLSDFSFGKTIGLSELDLSGNRFITLSANVFTGLENLKILKLENAGLNDFPEAAMRRLPALTELSLNSNPIEILDVATKPILLNLKSYHMRESQLNEIVDDSFISDLTRLIELDLGYSALENIPTKALENKPSLTTIYFDYSSIHRISKSDFEALLGNNISSLDISRSKIVQIENLAFFNLAHLTTLDLNSNQITSIADDAFSNTKLQSLDISYNNLTYISCAWFDKLPTDQLHTLKLSGNRYHCSCGMVGYRHYMTTPKYAMIMNAEDPVCASPSQFTGKNLSDIAIEDLENFCLQDADYFQPTYCSHVTTRPLEETTTTTVKSSTLSSTTSGGVGLRESWLKHLKFFSIVLPGTWFIRTS